MGGTLYIAVIGVNNTAYSFLVKVTLQQQQMQLLQSF